MSWRAYPTYAETINEWLGPRPSAWGEGPLKRWISRVESGTSVNAADVPAGPTEVGVLKTSCVYSGNFDIDENKTVLTEELDRVTCPVKQGTLIVSRMNTPELVGAAGYVDTARAGIYLPDRLWQVSFHGLSAEFVGFWSRTPAYRDQLKAVCVGTSSSMQNISQADYGSLAIAVPPVDDQQAIIKFLHEETAKIDTLIAKQEQLIATLSEDRTATIAHAITRGLDPEVEMTYSRVDWVDLVPSNWRLVPLKTVVSFQEGPGIMAEDFRDEGVPLLRVSSVRKARATLDGCNYLDPEKVRNTWSRFRVQTGDLLISASASMGTVAEVGPDVAGAIPYTGIIRVFTGPKVRREFMKWYFISVPFTTQIDLMKQGSTIQHYGPTHLSRMRLHVPTLNQQVEIAVFLDDRCGKIDALIAKANEVINTLREYRSAIITDAVTGKIDVRKAA